MTACEAADCDPRTRSCPREKSRVGRLLHRARYTMSQSALELSVLLSDWCLASDALALADELHDHAAS